MEGSGIGRAEPKCWGALSITSLTDPLVDPEESKRDCRGDEIREETVDFMVIATFGSCVISCSDVPLDYITIRFVTRVFLVR